MSLPTQYQTFIHKSRYARWNPKERRRETWGETVSRYVDYWKEKYPAIFENNPELYDLIYSNIFNLEVMPSMRALMTAGKALELHPTSGYNCAYTAIDNQKKFDEILYVLMCGTGMGFSVERQFVVKLPAIAEEFHNTDSIIKVGDSKIGWASSFRELIALLYAGKVPNWDLSKVRPAGAVLKTFGGRASGPGPLNNLFQFAVDLFKKAAGRKLNSLECHDLVCKIAEIVVCGGVRRSALISLSNLSDDRMRGAKSGAWWTMEPQRSLSNNSVAYTEKPDIGLFMKEWLNLYDSKSGERGIFNREAANKLIPSRRKELGYTEFGVNPCSEIILRSGQLCNLSEVVVKPEDTREKLLEKVRVAAIMGTFQATLTNFRYLSSEWRKNCEEEALLGVSLTGIMDHTILNGCDNFNGGLEGLLEEMKIMAVDTNIIWAKTLGINPATAVTAVKPSGCGTLDVKIKTNDGVITLGKIFEDNNVDLKKVTFGDWIIPEKVTFVFDENNEYQKVTKLYVNGISEVYEIVDNENNSYKFTGNHKVKLSNGEWKRIDCLSLVDVIKTPKYTLKIQFIKKLNESEMTLDIEVENTHSYQLSNGWVVHNTISQLVNSASGIHPRYSPFYVRTVRADNKDPLAKMLREQGVPCEPDAMRPDSTLVFSFPIKSPEDSVFRNDRTAIQQLELWKIYQKFWCEHKPSITIYVKEAEWLEVGAWVYKNFDILSGVSFLPHTEHAYVQAPYQEIGEEKYLELESKIPEISWDDLSKYESEDYTTGQQEFACTSGACEII